MLLVAKFLFFNIEQQNVAKIYLGSISKTLCFWFLHISLQKNFPIDTHCKKITEILTPDGVSKIFDLSGNPLQCLGMLKLKSSLLCVNFVYVFTLLRVPKNNHVKGFLGSILTQTWVLGSFLTPADALKSLGVLIFGA